MKKFLLTTIAASFMLAAGSSAMAAGFDFEYSVQRDSPVTQAFDNGRKTFIQLRKSVDVGMVFATDDQGERRPVAITGKSPYIEIDGTYKQIELVTANGNVAIQYGGKGQRIQASQPTLPAATTARFAAVSTVPPLASPIVVPSRTASAPVAVFGAAQPLGLDVKDTPKATEQNDPLTIPFAVGKTALGPKGRATIAELARSAKNNGKVLTVAVYSDPGADKSQAVVRGRAIRAELAKYGVNNADFRFGGTGQANDGILTARVAFLSDVGVSQSRPSASVVTAANPPVNFEQTLAPPKSLPATAATPSEAAISIESASSQDADEAKLTSMIDAEKKKLDGSIGHLTGLKDQGILNQAEYDAAKDRLESAFKSATASAQSKLNTIRYVREQTERARAEEFARAEQARKAASQPVEIPKLQIQAKPIWHITESDPTLHNLLDKWARSAGWTLVWKVGGDYSISAKATLEGSLDQVVNQVLASIQSSDMPLVATLYEGNKVIKIDTKE